MSSRSLNPGAVTIFLACGLSLAISGCAKRHVSAPVPVAAAPIPSSVPSARPMTIAPDTDATPPVDGPEAPPELPIAPVPPLPVSLAPPTPPAPQRSAADRTAQQPAAHPPAPQISPQLSPGDRATYERTTSGDIGVAEQNLRQAAGKQLSATQKDLVDKIRSFVAQSQDASNGGDWARAQNLAQKARLLSEELRNSL